MAKPFRRHSLSSGAFGGESSPRSETLNEAAGAEDTMALPRYLFATRARFRPLITPALRGAGACGVFSPMSVLWSRDSGRGDGVRAKGRGMLWRVQYGRGGDVHGYLGRCYQTGLARTKKATTRNTSTSISLVHQLQILYE